jgi:hypothetical protein
MRKSKDNVLIAEFMGCTNPFNEIHDATLYKVEQGTFELDELQYRTSWEWLMPVVEKIEQVHEGVPKQLINLSLFSTRQEIYQAVVEFINQLNK